MYFLILPRTLDPQTFAIVGGPGIDRLHQVVEKIDSNLKYLNIVISAVIVSAMANYN